MTPTIKHGVQSNRETSAPYQGAGAFVLVLVILAGIAQTGLTIIRLQQVAIPSSWHNDMTLQLIVVYIPAFLFPRGLDMKPCKHAILPSGPVVRVLRAGPIAFFGTAYHSTR